MGGVNTTRNYAKLMGFGYFDETTQLVKVTQPLLQGGIVAVYYLPGTLVGALFGGWFGDRFGRITTIGVASAWAIVGATLQCSAQNANWMFCARVFNGIGTGILNAITPVWATETASHTSRGAFVSIEFTLNIFGVVVAYWIEYGKSSVSVHCVEHRLTLFIFVFLGTSFYGDGTSGFIWRFPIAFQIIPLIGLLIVVWFMPEYVTPHLHTICQLLADSRVDHRAGLSNRAVKMKLDTS